MSQKKGEVRSEADKYWREKDLLQRELQIFEVNPPPGVNALKVNQIVRDLRELLERRRALYQREVSLVEELEKLDLMAGQLRGLDGNPKIKAHAKANLEDAMGQINLDFKIVAQERTDIMSAFRDLQTFEFGGTPPNQYANFGFDPAPRSKRGQLHPETQQNLVLDTMKITEFLNHNYDKLQKRNPKLASELEAVVRYLNGGDFTRQYESPNVQQELDKLAAKKTEAKHRQSQQAAAENKEKALREYKQKLVQAGKDLISSDYEIIKHRAGQADLHLYQEDFETFLRESDMYRAYYGDLDEDLLRKLAQTNKSMVSSNTAMMGVMRDELDRKQEATLKMDNLDVELARRRAELEREKLDIDILRLKAQQESPSTQEELLAAMKDFSKLLSSAHQTQAEMIKDVAWVRSRDQNQAQTPGTVQAGGGPSSVQPVIIPVYLPAPSSFGNDNEMMVLRRNAASAKPKPKRDSGPPTSGRDGSLASHQQPRSCSHPSSRPGSPG